MMERRLRQVGKLFQQDDTIAATTFGWFGYEGLTGVLPEMVLKVSDFIWKQKAVRHEFVIDGEESLQSADNDTENIFLGKMVHQWVPIKDALPHLDYIEVMVSKSHAVP